MTESSPSDQGEAGAAGKALAGVSSLQCLQFSLQQKTHVDCFRSLPAGATMRNRARWSLTQPRALVDSASLSLRFAAAAVTVVNVHSVSSDSLPSACLGRLLCCSARLTSAVTAVCVWCLSWSSAFGLTGFRFQLRGTKPSRHTPIAGQSRGRGSEGVRRRQRQRRRQTQPPPRSGAPWERTRSGGAGGFSSCAVSLAHPCALCARGDPAAGASTHTRGEGE